MHESPNRPNVLLDSRCEHADRPLRFVASDVPLRALGGARTERYRSTAFLNFPKLQGEPSPNQSHVRGPAVGPLYVIFSVPVPKACTSVVLEPRRDE